MNSIGAGKRIDALLDETADQGRSHTVAWRPRQLVSFGPRDTRASGYETAVMAAESHGFDTTERRFGGRAIAAHRECVSFIYTVPDPTETIASRYKRVSSAVKRATSADLCQGTLERSFCPGAYSLIGDGKVAGFAQRVRADAAAVGGVIIVQHPEPLLDVLTPVYEALDLPFDPATVGCLQEIDHTQDVEGLQSRLVDELEKLDSPRSLPPK